MNFYTKKNNTSKSNIEKVYDVITNQIIDKLKQGTVPWHRPWTTDDMPKNFISKKDYRGINTFLLLSMGYNSPYWLTFKQAKQKGGKIKKGEKGCPVVFWKWFTIDNNGEGAEEEIEGKKFPMVRYYTVFNIEQTEGIEYLPPQKKEKAFKPIEQCESTVLKMQNRPTIQHKESRAYYKVMTDLINMPKKELFDNNVEYYSTLFHEMTHATGHKTRLKRNTLTDMCAFGTTNYSKEELIAEMGAAYLCAFHGIENKTINNSIAYINSWLKKLRNDKKLIVHAAAQAQKASDYILSLSQD